MRLQEAVDQGPVLLFELRRHDGFPSTDLCNGASHPRRCFRSITQMEYSGLMHPSLQTYNFLATRIQQRAHIPGTRESVAALRFRISEIGLLIGPELRHATLAPATH